MAPEPLRIIVGLSLLGIRELFGSLLKFLYGLNECSQIMAEPGLDMGRRNLSAHMLERTTDFPQMHLQVQQPARDRLGIVRRLVPLPEQMLRGAGEVWIIVACTQ